MNDWVVVRTFTFPHEAHLARSALLAAGFEATVLDDHTIAMDWLYSNTLGGVKVLVRARDAAAAVELLKLRAVPAAVEGPREPDPSADDRCPRCGSADIEATVTGKRLAALTWLLANVPLVPVRRRARCRHPHQIVGGRSPEK